MYVASHGSAQQLYLRALDSLEAKPIPGTEGAGEPFFSPDGQWLGFFAGEKLKKVPILGGPTVTLGDAQQPRGASWSAQGLIALAPTTVGALQQVPDAGGTQESLTRLEKGDGNQRWPSFLPDGKALLFAVPSAAGSGAHAQIVVQTIGKSDRRILVKDGTDPRYAPSGHLIYAQGGNLMAVPFDTTRLTVTGPAVPVVEGILQSPITGASQYSISNTGSLVYISGGVAELQKRLVWVDRKGVEQLLPAPARDYGFAKLSPDGRRLAASISGGSTTDIWLYDLARDALTRLTFLGSLNAMVAWTPDGKRIAFGSTKEGPLNIFWQSSDGSGGLERLITSDVSQIPNSWSRDGQLLAFTSNTPTTGYDVWVLRLSDRKALPFLQTSFNETTPSFSPEGHWLAYASGESGRYEVYVQPYPEPGGKWQISTEGGTEPEWNRNGRELFYRNGRELFYRNGAKMMALDVSTQPSFAVGKARMLFEGQYDLLSAQYSSYDVSPDGQRFLMLKTNEQAAPTQINVVLNWFEEVKQKAPSGTK